MERILHFMCLILCCYLGVGEEEQDCPGAPQFQQDVHFELYYDAGTDRNNNNPVERVLSQICFVRDEFGAKLSIYFKPGATVSVDAGTLRCDGNLNGDCTLGVIHGCARLGIIDDAAFNNFVCCTRNKNADGCKQCAMEFGAFAIQFNECVNNKASADTLVANSIELDLRTQQVVVEVFPVPFFNRVFTNCLADQSLTFLTNTICKQLADKPSVCEPAGAVGG